MAHAREFQHMVDVVGLKDFGFWGSHFTFKRGRLRERLDGAFANVD